MGPGLLGLKTNWEGKIYYVVSFYLPSMSLPYKLKADHLFLIFSVSKWNLFLYYQVFTEEETSTNTSTLRKSSRERFIWLVKVARGRHCQARLPGAGLHPVQSHGLTAHLSLSWTRRSGAWALLGRPALLGSAQLKSASMSCQARPLLSAFQHLHLGLGECSDYLLLSYKLL